MNWQTAAWLAKKEFYHECYHNSVIYHQMLLRYDGLPTAGRTVTLEI